MNFLHEGDEIVVSVQSITPTWCRGSAWPSTGAKLVYMYPGENGRLTTEELDRKITPKTKVVAVAMVSNVLGLRAPVEEIVKRAHAVGAVVVLDCAQSRPHTPVDVKNWTWILLPAPPTSCTPHGRGRPVRPCRAAGKDAPFLSGGDMIALCMRAVPPGPTVPASLRPAPAMSAVRSALPPPSTT